MITRHRKARTLYGAVEHNGVLYFAGHAADDITQGMKEQTRQTCTKLETFLNAHLSQRHVAQGRDERSLDGMAR
jgi:enamine deaminase RidA (YjgF/YER057c/UK114 family)